MKGNQIDDLFRQRLSHQKLTPPPAAWGAIEQNLPQKKKKGAYFWMSIAASILVIFTIGGLLLVQGQKSDVVEPDTLAKTNAPEVKAPVKAEEPVKNLVAKENEQTPEIIKETLTEPAVQKLVAQTATTPAHNMASPYKKGRNTDEFNELLLREPIGEVALINIDQRLAPPMIATPLKNHDVVMPLDVTAYYILSNEELELTRKKKKFRVLNGIISIAKEVNSGKLSLSELRNAKNNFVEDDLKYGNKETDSDTEDEPESPGKD